MPTVQTGDITTYYEETGSGEPLILICGLSADLQVWRFIVPALAERYRVICYDNRGAGRSQAPDEAYSIGGMADDLTALLDQLDVDSAHVVGWSMGGLIAQAFALANPARVRKLGLLATCARPDAYLRLAISNWINIRQSSLPFEHVVRFVSRWQFTPGFYENEERYETIVRFMANNPYAQSLHGFLRQANAVLTHDPADAARDIGAPTLVLAGAFDNLTPLYLSEQLADLLPAASLQVLDCAHSGMVEMPDRYAAAVGDFLG